MRDTAAASKLKVQHLVTLASVGRHRNAHQAARELGLSQPAVSKIIREVEQVFAVQLFSRGRGGMHPNTIGEALIARAVALLNDLGQTRKEIGAIAAGEIGYLRLGVIAFATPALISGTLRSLARARAMLTLDVRENTTTPLVDQLLRRELDCVIGRYMFEREAELEQQILYYQRFVAVVTGAHPLTSMKRPSLTDAAAFGWIVPPSRTAARQALSGLFMREKLPPPQVRIETSSLEIIKAALAESDLIGLLPIEIARALESSERLHILPFNVDDQPAPLTLILRRNESRPPSVARFCDTVTSVAADIARTLDKSDVKGRRSRR
jgi:DNA-binding transcriptional LysR family regulator